MRCDDVIRELAAPTDDRDTAAVADHLSTCPACAGWAKRNAQIDRLWEATRPFEPSLETWDGVWAHLVSSFSSSNGAAGQEDARPNSSRNGSAAFVTASVSRHRPTVHPRRWRWAAIGLVGLAQAAAIVFAVTWAWRPLEIDEGHVVVIHAEGLVPKVIDVTPAGISYGVDDWYLAFNAVESMASPVVAMQE
jgi:hypothetical protein